MTELAERIRLLRREQGLSQEQLAERSDLSTDTIRRIELGRTLGSITSAKQLAKGLGLPLATLFLPGGADNVHDLVVLAARARTSEIVGMLLRRSDEELVAIATIIRVAFERPLE